MNPKSAFLMGRIQELHEDGDVLLDVDVGRQLVEIQLDPDTKEHLLAYKISLFISIQN
jgi:glyoxylate carboligase